MSKVKKETIWNNRWIVSTGSIVLGAILLKGLDWLFGTKILIFIWGFIINTIKNIFSFLLFSFEIQIWEIILIFITGSAVIYIYAWFRNMSDKSKLDQKPYFLDYTEDEFAGVLYKWEYGKDYQGKYFPHSYVPYCPKDNCILHYEKCPICSTYFGRSVKGNSELEKLIIHKIENQLIK